ATTDIYTLSLHDALPIYANMSAPRSLPSVPKAESGNEYCFHSAPAANIRMAGICDALPSVSTARVYTLPSPLAQKPMVFLPDRLAGSGCMPSADPGA